MDASKDAYNLIKRFEFDGKVPPLVSYWDKHGEVWTIGWGHTKGVTKGMHITLKQAEQFLYDDVQKAVDVINRLIKMTITQSMFDALVDFVFNLGAGSLEISTLLKKLNKGDFLGASEEFPRWIYSGNPKVILPGLVRRRAAEQKLFLQDVGITNREVL